MDFLEYNEAAGKSSSYTASPVGGKSSSPAGLAGTTPSGSSFGSASFGSFGQQSMGSSSTSVVSPSFSEEVLTDGIPFGGEFGGSGYSEEAPTETLPEAETTQKTGSGKTLLVIGVIAMVLYFATKKKVIKT